VLTLDELQQIAQPTRACILRTAAAPGDAHSEAAGPSGVERELL
jgi:hypothetical protein